MTAETPQKAEEWHKANLERERKRLAVMEAACGTADAAAINSLVIEQRKKIALIEKLLAGRFLSELKEAAN